MNAALPPERDLPSHRHAEIRRALTSTVRARPLSRSARWLVPAVAAAAVAAISVGAVGARALRPAPHPVNPVATASPQPSIAAPAEPVVPGVSAEKAVEIARGCAKSFGVPDHELPGEPPPASAAPSPTPDPEATRIPRGNDAKLYNLVTDATGTHGLVLGSDLALNCTIGESAAWPYNAGGGGMNTPLDWLPGHLVVDISAGSAGRRGGPGAEEYMGRVSAQVASVTMTFPDGPVTATPINGTFIIRKLHPSWSSGIPDDQPVIPIRALDAAGRVLFGPGDGDSFNGCWVDPSSNVVIGRKKDAQDCKPAVAWTRGAK